MIGALFQVTRFASRLNVTLLENMKFHLGYFLRLGLWHFLFFFFFFTCLVLIGVCVAALQVTKRDCKASLQIAMSVQPEVNCGLPDMLAICLINVPPSVHLSAFSKASVDEMIKYLHVAASTCLALAFKRTLLL